MRTEPDCEEVDSPKGWAIEAEWIGKEDTMKTIRWKAGVCAFVVASLSAGMICAAEDVETEPAAERMAAVSEDRTMNETEAALEPFSLSLRDGTVLTIQNESGMAIQSAEVAGDEADEPRSESGEGESAESGSDAAEENDTLIVTLVSGDGAEHLFEEFPASPENPVLISDDGFLFLKYKGSDGNSVYAYETADEVTFEKPKTKYITDRVYIRSEPSQDSEILGVAELGSEVKVFAARPKWCLVESGDLRGYVGRARISPSKEAAEAAVATEETLRAEIAAAAARAAAQAQAARSAAPARNGNTVVSRQWVEDCDGSGNGYYVVKHANGSVTYEDG